METLSSPATMALPAAPAPVEVSPPGEYRLLSAARRLSRLRVHWFTWVFDVLVVEAAFLGAFYLRFGGRIPAHYAGSSFAAAALLLAVAYTALDLGLHAYRIVWRHATLVDMATLALTILGTVVVIGFTELGPMAQNRPIPLSVLAVGGLGAYLLLAHVKLVPRAWQVVSRPSERRPVLIFGAGESGAALARELSHGSAEYRAVAFLDDDLRNVGREVAGLPVVGTAEALGRALRHFHAEAVVVATPSEAETRIRDVSAMIVAAGARPLLLPSIGELMRGNPGPGGGGASELTAANGDGRLTRAPGRAPAPAPTAVALVERGGNRPLTVSASRGISIRRWTGLLMVLDIGVALMAFGVGTVARFGEPPSQLGGLSYVVIAALLPAVWLGAMVMGGTYDRRYLAVGPEQFRRVATSAVWALALVTFTSYAFHASISRILVAIVISAATIATLAERFAARSVLRHRLAAGGALHRVLVVGTPDEADQVTAHLERNRHTGFVPVALFSGSVDPDHLIAEVRRTGADTIALASPSGMAPGALRELSWALEGCSIRLVVVPGLADLAGPRIHVNSVEGLPFLEISEPELSGGRRAAKETFDRLTGALLLIACLPLMLVVGIAIKLGDRGPIFFRQLRIGKDGREFVMWKFRTMRPGADTHFRSLHAEFARNGMLLKLAGDSRVTHVGSFLRRHSIDELPQLLNVLSGSMSLVGPRPYVPHEIAQFPGQARLRLRVKPGMTGPWQVGGRSDLPWQEIVRLDLYYVENWSIWLDVAILWRTLRAVLRPRGAY
jgi:exopolysaccharide biosynthesis polyprenyl glycosylphosphotransferase